MTEADSTACDYSPAFASDRIVRLVATDGYQVHRLIYAFAECEWWKSRLLPDEV